MKKWLASAGEYESKVRVDSLKEELQADKAKAKMAEEASDRRAETVEELERHK